jgi:hypothetical protein|tara:strand:- start:265 stop:744 length:480 start_codon:yes stop_codon:yes gene_type:complete
MYDGRLSREERLTGILSKAIGKKNGNMVRHVMKIVSRTYRENPEELREYFSSHNKLIAGIATSAYNFLTRIIEPIQEIEYGGFGAIINNGENGLEFGRNQLWFARLDADSLWYSRISDCSLWYAEIEGRALRYSEFSDSALKEAKFRGTVKKESLNFVN